MLWEVGPALAMETEGWFSVNDLKYLVKWHHSGSYQLYPGNILSDMDDDLDI